MCSQTATDILQNPQHSCFTAGPYIFSLASRHMNQLQGPPKPSFRCVSQYTTDVVGGPHNLESHDRSCCAGGPYFFSLASWQVNQLQEGMATYPDIAHKTQMMSPQAPPPSPPPNAMLPLQFCEIRMLLLCRRPALLLPCQLAR